MVHEFEIVSYGETNFKIFMVNMLYRTPHIHKDFEIGYVLNGTIDLITLGQVITLQQGDFLLMNPFQSHELKTDHPALVLTVQVPSAFFSAYYKPIESLEFISSRFHRDENEAIYDCLKSLFLNMAQDYFSRSPFFEIKCASMLNQCFLALLQVMEHRFVSEKERVASKAKATRMRSILRYIDEHYSEKLLLSHVATQEQLSLYYLSHLFKDSFGMSFQNYLLRIRCEKARQLLLLTNQSLIDICIACGFSDPKYFNHGFKKQYHCTPKEYRKQFYHEESATQQKSVLTTQKFLPFETSLEMLQLYHMN
ncbi:MAG: AraC family transcriptional regulator [Lachnospiraceae bacterium]|nr:AraC family transcriptional regulator [Lachnospiraceae bacterium]